MTGNNGLTKFVAGIHHALGIQDLGFLLKTDDPTQEKGRYRHFNNKGEMVFSVRNHHGVLAETIDDHIGKGLVEPEFYPSLGA